MKGPPRMPVAVTTTTPQATATLLNERYFQTDDANNNHQYVKRISDQHYLIAQENPTSGEFDLYDINLADYTLEDIRKIVTSAYDSIQQAFEAYSRNAVFTCQVIAELIAEHEAGY